MKTTVEVPDGLYQQLKVRAALQGQTVKAFLLEAIRDKLLSDKKSTAAGQGWRMAFGKGDKEAVADVQRIIDEEFSQIDYEEWGLPNPADDS